MDEIVTHQPGRKPWMIKAFDESLREDLKAAGARQGLDIGRAAETACRQWVQAVKGEMFFEPKHIPLPEKFSSELSSVNFDALQKMALIAVLMREAGGEEIGLKAAKQVKVLFNAKFREAQGLPPRQTRVRKRSNTVKQGV